MDFQLDKVDLCCGGSIQCEECWRKGLSLYKMMNAAIRNIIFLVGSHSFIACLSFYNLGVDSESAGDNAFVL